MMEVYKFKPFKPNISGDYARADLEIYGINHFRPSYTGLIFFNIGKFDPKKMGPDHPSCAGSFSIFGHPECTGDKGHCDMNMPPPARFDTRRSSPLTKAFKRVVVTDHLRAALTENDTLSITIAVADENGTKKRKKSKKKTKRLPLFECGGLQIATFAEID